MTQHSEDQELELEFTVKLRTYGSPDKLADKLGKQLAKVCSLALPNVTVTRDDQVFTWSPQDHSG